MEGLAIDRTFWHGKRVFVTGHTGFKGSWLCLWLVRLGADVYGYALPPVTDPNLFTAARLARNVVSIEGDIRDADRLRAAIATHAPEIVFHLAAQALVVESYVRPLETYATNVLGTANLLEALRDSSCARVGVIVTSDKCYALGNSGDRHAENDPLGGADPYSSSKACAEFVTAAYRSAFFDVPSKGAHSKLALRTTIASARAGNIIGGGDWSSHRLIPDAVNALRAGKPLRLRNPRAVRPWQYVLDPLNGYLRLAEYLWQQGAPAEAAWNFGPPPDHELEVETLVREFAKHWGSGLSWQAEAESAFPEAVALRLNSERANRRLGWQARVSMAAALSATAEWYRSFYAGRPADELVNGEIEHFAARSTAQ